MKTLKIYDFEKFYNDIHYVYSFTKDKKRYELCLEPCMQGFCVGLYEKKDNDHMLVVTHKQCTQKDGYGHDLFGTGARHPDTWEKALKMANLMVKNYFEKS